MTQNFKIYFLFLLFFACQKNDNLPLTYVNIVIDLNQADYAALQVVGTYVYLIGGSRGIIVYRKSFAEYIAYERHCPFQPESTCGLVSVDNQQGFLARDYCCGSVFSLQDGSVLSGPAARGLKTYATFLDGNNLYIRNAD